MVIVYRPVVSESLVVRDTENNPFRCLANLKGAYYDRGSGMLWTESRSIRPEF